MSTDVQAILRLEVPVIVQVAERELRVEEVRSLSPGAIIEFPKDTKEDLEILVNDRPVAAGRAVKVGENFGVRVTFVGDLKDRIKAMGESAGAPVSATSPKPEPATI